MNKEALIGGDPVPQSDPPETVKITSPGAEKFLPKPGDTTTNYPRLAPTKAQITQHRLFGGPKPFGQMDYTKRQSQQGSQLLNQHQEPKL